MRNEEALYKEAEDARRKKKDRESILDDIVSWRMAMHHIHNSSLVYQDVL